MTSLAKSKFSLSAVIASLALTLTLTLTLAATPAAAASEKQQAIVDKATGTLRNFASATEMQWFRENVHQAKALVIFPSNVKGGFIIGGSGGSGVMIARMGNGWSYPAFYTTGSFTFGLQFGGQVSELVLMVMTQKGVDAMLSPEFKLGGDVSVAAGPVGAGAKGQTADIIAFARGKGLYGGLNVEGTVITTREKWNAKYYYPGVRTSDILISGKASNAGANSLRNAAANIPNY